MAEPNRRDHSALAPAGSEPSQESPPGPIERQPPVVVPIDQAEDIDFELTLVELPQERIVEDIPSPPVWTQEEPLPSLSDVVLSLSMVEDAQSELEQIANDQPVSPAVEYRTAVKRPNGESIVSGDDPSADIPSSTVLLDDSDLQRWPKQTAPSPTKEVEWPSAKDILATYRAASSNRMPAAGRKKTTTKIEQSGVVPTLSCSPSQWHPPVALAGSAAVVFVLSVGLLGCVLSWTWAHDSYTASLVTERLLTSDRVLERRPLPDTVQPPENGWMISTSAHLTNWAIFLSRFAGDENQSPAEPAVLLERALAASPINAQARFAMAQLEPADGTKPLSVRSLGLSRDATSLAWSARRLLAAGKKDDALKLYGRAIAIAVPARSPRSRIPRFSEDPDVPRYLLPGEEQVRDIVRDLVSQNVWPFDEWSRVLPERPVVLIATARLLREHGRSEAERVLDLILKDQSLLLTPGQADPVMLAALAEAFALRSRFKEADQLYRQAIDSIPDATIQRTWWFNLADIAYRFDRDAERQAALRSASSVAFSDDITRRATDIQRATLIRSTGVKAN